MLADTNTMPGVVIPEAFRSPDWVQDKYDSFMSKVKEDYSKNKILNSNLVRTLIKETILDNKVRVSFPLNKKNVSKLLNEMYKVFDTEEFQYRYYLIYRIGFTLSTFASISFTPDSLELPNKFKPTKKKIVDEYHAKLDAAKNDMDREKAYFWVDKAFKKLAKEVLIYFREHPDEYPVVDLLDSGAKGSEDDIRKLLIAVGLSINAKGEINDVIDRSGAEGLSPTQFFNYTSQAIVSQFKKSSETAIPGYLIRQLNTIVSGVQLSRTKDCKSNRYLKIKIQSPEMLKSLDGKLRKTGTGLAEISQDDKQLVGRTVEIRSPLYCQATDGICLTCYNPKFTERMHLEENAGIGLLASTSMATLLTNMTLKAAHTGLSLNKEQVNLAEDILEYSE